MILGRNEILSSNDIETREVDAHEWGKKGDKILVRALSLEEANEWRRSMLVKETTRDQRGKLETNWVFDQQQAEKANAVMLSIAIVDENGQRVFTEPGDIDRLYKKSPKPIARAVRVVMEISGLNANAEEEEEKNSAPSPSA